MYEINLIVLAYSLNLESSNYPHCKITAMNSTLLPKKHPTENSTEFDYDCQEERSLILFLAEHGSIGQWLNGIAAHKKKRSLFLRR